MYGYYGFRKTSSLGNFFKNVANAAAKAGAKDARYTNAAMIQDATEAIKGFSKHSPKAKEVAKDILDTLITGGGTVEKGQKARRAVESMFDDFDNATGVAKNIRNEGMRRLSPLTEAITAAKEGLTGRAGLSNALKAVRALRDKG